MGDAVELVVRQGSEYSIDTPIRKDPPASPRHFQLSRPITGGTGKWAQIRFLHSMVFVQIDLFYFTASAALHAGPALGTKSCIYIGRGYPRSNRRRSPRKRIGRQEKKNTTVALARAR